MNGCTDGGAICNVQVLSARVGDMPVICMVGLKCGGGRRGFRCGSCGHEGLSKLLDLALFRCYYCRKVVVFAAILLC